MTTKTTITCDRCKHEAANASEFQQITIKLQAPYIQGVRTSPFSAPQAYRGHVCKTCYDALGFLKKDAETAPTTFEQLEDLIREIIRDEMEANP